MSSSAQVFIPSVSGKNRDTLLPVAAILGYAFARGRGWGVAAKVSSTLAGYIAGEWARRRVTPQHTVSSSNLIPLQWAPIGLLDMLNPVSSTFSCK